MIIKKASRKKNSSIKKLINYLIRETEADDKIDIKTTNLSSEIPAEIIEEFQALQNLNEKTKADKTSHYIVSFPLGENPSKEKLEIIEEEFLKSVGLENHQRASMLHEDTAYTHLHIVINNISPEPPYKNVQPSWEIKKLQAKRAELEENLGLQKLHEAELTIETLKDILGSSESWPEIHYKLRKHDAYLYPKGRGLIIKDTKNNREIKPSDINRKFSRKGLEIKYGGWEAPDRKNNITNIEVNSNTESFHTWAKRELHPIIGKSTNWQQLQDEINPYNLIIKPAGRGLIIQHQTEPTKRIKLSDIDRKYSKANLEKQYEQPFRMPRIKKKKTKKKINPKIHPSSKNLWNIWLQENEPKKETRTFIYKQAKIDNQRIWNDGTLSYDAKIRLSHQIKLRRITALKKNDYQSWNDYLIYQSESGNTNAISYLQRKSKIPADQRLQFYDHLLLTYNDLKFTRTGNIIIEQENQPKIVITKDLETTGILDSKLNQEINTILEKQ